MQLLSTVALLAWLPIVCYLFLILPARKAVMVSYLSGWLFLPVSSLPIQGFLDYDKSTAISLGTLLAAVLFDWDKRLFKIRPSKMDVPALVWCLCPFVSSVSNDLGIYDGMAGVADQFVTWGIPYIMGRAYFEGAEAMGRLSIGIFLSGLVYVPLCLYEVRMSPQLHKTLYGAHQHVFSQSWRFGGWRPTVFLQHGLAVGMWMTTASLIGCVLLTSGTVRSVLGWPMNLLVAITIVTSVLCKSIGAIFLFLGGCGTYWLSILVKSRLIIFALVGIVPLYLTVRVRGLWFGDELVSLSQEIDKDRAQSLKTRLDNETLLVDKAMLNPSCGWGRWGRSRVYGEDGEDVSITDSQWIIALGESGLVGLTAYFSMLLLPVLKTIARFHPRTWNNAQVAPVISLAICLALYSIDNLLNAMVNPIFMLMAGGLVNNSCKVSNDVEAALGARAV
jgi:O-antigen ligase